MLNKKDWIPWEGPRLSLRSSESLSRCGSSQSSVDVDELLLRRDECLDGDESGLFSSSSRQQEVVTFAV